MAGMTVMTDMTGFLAFHFFHAGWLWPCGGCGGVFEHFLF
jgi:hypothetical protein